MNEYKNKIAVVSGASRGIGKAIAMGLARAGAHVVVSSRKLPGVTAVAEEIQAKGGTAEAMRCHAGELNEVTHMIDAVDKKFGRLDMLVNCAATNPHYGPAAELSPEAFDKTVEVNLKGPYFLMSRAVELMARGGGGSIVNVASIVVNNPMTGQAVYAMTKVGLTSLTKSFAKEYGRAGIRVNAILPGLVETHFASTLISDPRVAAWLKTLPVPRAAEPDEMVGGVLYLLSDAASYTTGTTLLMDGGASLGPL